MQPSDILTATVLRIDNTVPSARERTVLWRAARGILEHSPGTGRRVGELARRVHDLTARVDSFIQTQTAAVCPDCEKVCCINRHAFHDRTDVLYLAALGQPLPDLDETLPLPDPCQLLGPRGCTVNRELRPYRCNWYFCSPLLRHMEQNASPAGREFSRIFQDLIDTRSRMVDVFLEAAAGTDWRGR